MVASAELSRPSAPVRGWALPEPLATRRYSGQFKVRITPQVHRQLVIEAAEAKVSLNRLISAKLAHG